MMQARDLFKYSENYWNNECHAYFARLDDEFFDNIINLVNQKRKEIHKLKRVSIAVLKNDISPSTYSLLESNHVENMFDLVENIRRYSNGAIVSRLASIGPKKGDEILRAMKKAGYPKSSNLHFERVL